MFVIPHVQKKLQKDMAIITLSMSLITRDYQPCISYNKLVVTVSPTLEQI